METKNDDGNVIIGSFCPKHGRQEVKVPEDVVEAHIRWVVYNITCQILHFMTHPFFHCSESYSLTGVSLRPPQFEIRWKYTDVLLPGLSESQASGCGISFFHARKGPFLLALVFWMLELREITSNLNL